MNASLMTAAATNGAPVRVAPVQRPGDCLRVIRAEYREMPGLSLTEAQAARLWQLAAGEANEAMHELVSTGFLRCNRSGRYVRADLWSD